MLRVLTWNLWWQFGPWEARQPAITEVLRSNAPDVVVLQEVYARGGDDQAERLGRELGMCVERTRHDDGRPHEFGNAVLSRHPMRRCEQIVLPKGDGTPSHRSALACEVETPNGTVPVVVTHLEWRYGQSATRQRQLAEVCALAMRHTIDDRPVVIAGDLNATPECDEIRRLTGAAPPYVDGVVFTDVWAAVGDGPGHTWTRANPHAAEALWPRRRLDYVLVSWPRAKPWCNPRTAILVGEEPHDGMVASDHYGVLVELDDRPQYEDRK